MHEYQWFGPLVLALILCLIFRRRRWHGSRTACGTARFAEDADLSRNGMLSNRGLLLGRTLRGRLICLPASTVHCSIFAPTGAGKNVSLITPWLLTYRAGSCVVLDPKGENFRLSAARRRAIGQRIVRIDPFSVCGPGSHSFNPLDLISEAECIDDARAFAEMTVIRPTDGGERDPHWSDMAALCTCAFLVLIMKRLPLREERTLSSLRELIADPKSCEEGAATLRDMGGIYARLGGVLSQMQDKERAGVMSTVNRHTAWIDSPAIGTCTATSTFDVRDLLAGNMTIYLILPAHQAEAQARWLRTVIGALLRLIGREGMRPGKECLFVLDEAGQVGHMPPLEQGLTLMRGAGLRMAFFFQSLTQLREVFREKEGVLLDNTDQIYFGTQSYETAERISKMCGEQTITVESANESYGDSRQAGSGLERSQGPQSSRNRGRNWSVQARALLQPSEVLTMSSDYLLAFFRGFPPVLARRVRWFRDPAFGTARRFPPLLWWVALAGSLALLARGLSVR